MQPITVAEDTSHDQIQPRFRAVRHEGRFDIRWLHLIQLNDYGRQIVNSVSRQLNFFIEIPSMRFYKQSEHYFNIPIILLLSQTLTKINRGP